MPNAHRKNLQAKQPNIQYEPEGNGWSEPLADESNPVTYKYTTGKSGSSTSKPVTDVQVKQ